MRFLNDLLHDVAAHLVGEPTVITYNEYIQDVSAGVVMGHAQRNLKGIPYINLNPAAMSGDKFLFYFLHECAHFRAGNFIPSQVENRVTLPTKPTNPFKIAAENTRETRCDEMANTWIAWGKRMANDDPAVPDWQLILEALLKYPVESKVKK